MCHNISNQSITSQSRDIRSDSMGKSRIMQIVFLSINNHINNQVKRALYTIWGSHFSQSQVPSALAFQTAIHNIIYFII